MNDSAAFTCTEWNTIVVPDDHAASDWLHTTVDAITCTVIIPLIMIVGGLSNIAFIYMVARLPRMQTITNFYLINIAIADLLLGVIVPALYIAAFFASPVHHDIHERFRIEFCYVSFFLAYWGYLASVGNVTLVSFERFLAVCNPLVHMRVQRKGRTVRLLVFVWLITLLMAGPLAVGKGNLVKWCMQWPDDVKYDDLPTVIGLCQSFGTGSVNAVFTRAPEVVEFTSFVIAMIVNSVFYTFIIRALSSRGAVTGADSSQQDQMIKIRNQVARALIINGILFFVTQTPYRFKSANTFVEDITGTGFLTKSQFDSITIIGRGGLFLNSSINSFIYAFSSEFYRNGFIEIFSKSCAAFPIGPKSKEKDQSIATETSVTMVTKV